MWFDTKMATDSIESNFVSMKPAVEFINILDLYSYNDDLHCSFKLNEYTPQEGDRIAIFKLGWNFVKDYVVFEWVPLDTTEKQYSVIFNKHIIPKNNTEIYQICYISGENVLHGASSPFQFCMHTSPPILTQSTLSVASNEDISEKTQVPSNRDDDMNKLREENAMLRECIKVMMSQKTTPNCKNYDAEISELKKVTDSLKTSLSLQQKEISGLKLKIVQSGEEFGKLYLEKVKTEKKYEKLKNKMEVGTKPVSELINFDIGDLKSIPPFPFAK